VLLIFTLISCDKEGTYKSELELCQIEMSEKEADYEQTINELLVALDSIKDENFESTINNIEKIFSTKKSKYEDQEKYLNRLLSIQSFDSKQKLQYISNYRDSIDSLY
jgi:7,8-dihydro-6-hydroxymethylpterin-pyrophosphokinase